MIFTNGIGMFKDAGTVGKEAEMSLLRKGERDHGWMILQS